MGKAKISFIKLLFLAAVTGNILFVLWVTVNGLKEHFNGTIYEKLSYIGLIGLLTTNTHLLFHLRKKKYE